MILLHLVVLEFQPICEFHPVTNEVHSVIKREIVI